MNGIAYASIVMLALALCWLWPRHDPAAPGPDAEEASRGRQGNHPPELPVVSGEPSHPLDTFADAFSSDLPVVGQYDQSLFAVRNTAGADALSSSIGG